MRICKLDRAALIYGAGGPSLDFGSSYNFNFGPIIFTPADFAIKPTASNASLGGSSHTSGGSLSSNTSIGNIFGTDSGVTNGKRDDGQPLGYGCGNAKTDAYVPDHLFGHDLTPACQNHDIGYSTCGVAKDVADAKLGSDVSAAMGGGLLGGIVGSIYHAGVAIAGQSSYDQAQTDAGCRNTGGGGGGGGQSDHSGESGAGRSDARGGYGSYGGGGDGSGGG